MIVSPHDVVILLLLAVVSQRLQSPGHGFIASDDDAAITISPEVLGRIEGEGRRMAQRADPSSPVLSAVGLAGILNHPETVPSGDFQNGVHVGGLSVEMHRDDCLGLGVDGPFQPFDVQIKRQGIDVDQNGSGTGIGNGQGSGDKSVCGRDHLIALPDVVSSQGQFQG